jgi:hypothetical protein
MSWEGHQESVAAATNVIGEAQDLISQLTEKLEQALGATIMATGQTPNVESAAQAMDMLSAAKRETDTIFRYTEQAKMELDRYARGF